VLVVSSGFRRDAEIKMHWSADTTELGLTDYLINKDLTTDDILHKVDQPGIELVLRGTKLDAALPLLVSQRMKDLISGICDRSD
jgi:hypothetical protein